MIKINETPRRTSRNFLINNIKLENFEVPNYIKEFENIEIVNDNSKIQIEKEVNNEKLRYGLGDGLTNQVLNYANVKFKLTIEGKTNKETIFNFNLDEENSELVENIEIIANENTKSTLIFNLLSEGQEKYFHNGIIKILAKENSELNIIITNLLNSKSYNFIAIENELKENSKVKYTIIDFGGKASITNYYSNQIGNNANNILHTIYIGNETQIFDLNYIAELTGNKTNIEIDVQGALKDNAKKHFKGTIDFKKGAKKATGSENENCILLSDTAKSIALPMLLCSEEDVEGAHSCSAGKVNPKELFYIQTRGFDEKSAMKLLVRAKFNKILEDIKNEKLKQLIINEIDKRLD